MNLIGPPRVVAAHLRKFLPSARIVTSEVSDPVIWEAVRKDASFSGLIEAREVSRSYQNRVQFGKDRKDQTVYVFIKSLTLDVVVHIRTKTAMQNIINTAVVQSVMES